MLTLLLIVFRITFLCHITIYGVDVFKSLGSDDMGRDDLILAADIVITALSRLWVYETKRDAEDSNYDRMKRVTEDVADRALLKVGNVWFCGRFSIISPCSVVAAAIII